MVMSGNNSNPSTNDRHYSASGMPSEHKYLRYAPPTAYKNTQLTTTAARKIYTKRNIGRTDYRCLTSCASSDIAVLSTATDYMAEMLVCIHRVTSFSGWLDLTAFSRLIRSFSLACNLQFYFFMYMHAAGLLFTLNLLQWLWSQLKCQCYSMVKREVPNKF